MKKHDKQWQKDELQAGKDLGGKATPKSGAGVIKGDRHVGSCLLEVKSTSGDTYTLSWKTLHKLCGEARDAKLIPVLCVYTCNDRLILARLHDFLDFEPFADYNHCDVRSAKSRKMALSAIGEHEVFSFQDTGEWISITRLEARALSKVEDDKEDSFANPTNTEKSFGSPAKRILRPGDGKQSINHRGPNDPVRSRLRSGSFGADSGHLQKKKDSKQDKSLFNTKRSLGLSRRLGRKPRREG